MLAGFTLSLVVVAHTPSDPSDERLHQAFSYLTEAEQGEFVEWLRMEQRSLRNLQQQFIRDTLDAADQDPGLFPIHPGPRFYDPQKHAPGLPIPRTILAKADPRLAKAQEEMLPAADPRELQSGWTYDWGSREIYRNPNEGDPTRIFTNALNGYPVDLDLARALCLRSLDTGGFQAALGAFDHTYTDRDGNVYPGITLYDSWRSGQVMEMPDVDALGIIHDVLDDWTTWVSPVPGSKHRELYDRIGRLYQEARKYRTFREALADCFLIGMPIKKEGFGETYGRFHAIWDAFESKPEALSINLPAEADWWEFVDQWSRKIWGDPELAGRGERRAKVLQQNGQVLRKMITKGLKEFGAMDRTSRPQPLPATPEEG